MKFRRFSGTTLLNRIVCFLIAFSVTIILQMGISYYQSVHILEPLENRTEKIQSISQFLNDVESCMLALENYRWDLGDSQELVSTLREEQRLSGSHLNAIDRDLSQVSEEQYLLANAAATTYSTFSRTVDEIIELLLAGKSDEASALYYSKTEPCGGYMRQYTQQLLEQAIRDNQSAYNRLNRLNGQLKYVQSLVIFLCLFLGVVLMKSLLALLKSVKAMTRASRDIREGNLDTPDVDEGPRNEIGQMAKVFNDMKHSMKRQMTLLNEKNEMERKLHTQETEALEMRALMEREKLQQLRSQINPHFLFNTLNVILYTSKQEGAKTTHTLISSLSRLFRYALGSNEDQVPLSREIHIVDELYALYRARFTNRIEMQWHISPQIDLTETIVPSFILQPLVENAFKHGLGPKEEGGCVNISISTEAEGQTLQIAVMDNGVGMSREALAHLQQNLRNPPTSGEHIGVYNVAARLRLWGAEYGMDIQSEQGKGTTAALRLPLITLPEEETSDD